MLIVLPKFFHCSLVTSACFYSATHAQRAICCEMCLSVRPSVRPGWPALMSQVPFCISFCISAVCLFKCCCYLENKLSLSLSYWVIYCEAVTDSCCYYDYYYAAFNAPCVGHKDDESQAKISQKRHWFRCEIGISRGVDPMCFSGSGPTHFLGAGSG